MNSSDLASKLQFDNVISTYVTVDEGRKEIMQKLMETIKVPYNLRQLNHVLPKACYPDVRPYSPSAWTVADQNLRPPLPPAVEKLVEIENIPPVLKQPNKLSPYHVNQEDSRSKDSRQPISTNQDLEKKQHYVSKIPSGIAYPREVNPLLPIAPYSRIPLIPSIPVAVKQPVNFHRAQYQQHRMW